MRCPLCTMEVTEEDFRYDNDPEKWDTVKNGIKEYKKKTQKNFHVR